MRVPPDQSGIAAAALRQGQVGVGHGEGPSEPGQARGEHEGLGARGPHRAVQQVEVGPCVGLHRARDVGEQHEPPGSLLGPAMDTVDGVAAVAVGAAQRGPQVEVATGPVALAPGG